MKARIGARATSVGVPASELDVTRGIHLRLGPCSGTQSVEVRATRVDSRAVAREVVGRMALVRMQSRLGQLTRPVTGGHRRVE